MQEIKLSISIVHHNGRDMLRECLNSIFSSAPALTFEVIVVDNASTDGSVEMIETLFPQVFVIKNNERHGFGRNQNKGIEHCRGEYILVYNDDTVVRGNAHQTLCDFLDQHSDVGLVVPKLLNPDGSWQISCYKFPNPLRYVWENLLLADAFPQSTIFGDYRKWTCDAEREVDWVTGAAMLVRKSVVEQIGLFDERFFMYFEEVDWQMRMRKAGFRIMLSPQSEIIHLGGQSTSGAEDNQFAEFLISSIKLITKHYGIAGAVIQRFFILVGSLLSIAVWSTISLLNRRKRKEGNLHVQKSMRLFRWWIGLGPNEGLSIGLR